MEYQVRITAPVNLDSIEERLLESDPAGLVDEGGAGLLRISTSLPPAELAAVLAAAGHPASRQDIEAQPSVCCGGCGG